MMPFTSTCRAVYITVNATLAYRFQKVHVALGHCAGCFLGPVNVASCQQSVRFYLSIV